MSGKVHPQFLRSRQRELAIVKKFGGEDLLSHYHVAPFLFIDDFSYRPLNANESEVLSQTLVRCSSIFKSLHDKWLHIIAHEGNVYEVIFDHKGNKMQFTYRYSYEDAVLVLEHYEIQEDSVEVKNVGLYDVILDIYTPDFNIDHVVRESFGLIEHILREYGYIE